MRGARAAGGEPEGRKADEPGLMALGGEPAGGWMPRTSAFCRRPRWAGRQREGGGEGTPHQEQLLFCRWPSRWCCQPGAQLGPPAPPRPRPPPADGLIRARPPSPPPSPTPAPAPRPPPRGLGGAGRRAEPGSQVLPRTAGSLATESIMPSRWCSHGVMDITHDSLRQSRNSLAAPGPLYTK